MVENGRVKFPLPEGIALAAVLGRHGQEQPPSLSFTTGYPIREGAIASTVSHDSHNLVIIGRQPDDLLAAARSLEVMGGGLVLVNHGNLLASLPLPIAGLLNPLPLKEIAALETALENRPSILGVVVRRDRHPALHDPASPAARTIDRPRVGGCAGSTDHPA